MGIGHCSKLKKSTENAKWRKPTQKETMTCRAHDFFVILHRQSQGAPPIGTRWRRQALSGPSFTGSASVLPLFCLRSASVLTPLWLLFSADEMPINTGVSAISDKSPIRAKASKVEKTPDFSSIFVSPRARVSIQRPLPHRKRDFQRLSFPDCEIRQTEMAETVKEGGALHCISWNIPVWTPNQCWTLMNNPVASYHLLCSHS